MVYSACGGVMVYSSLTLVQAEEEEDEEVTEFEDRDAVSWCVRLA